MANLDGKTLFITGASRGIGKAIALRAAADGANVAIVSKTAEPHPRLPGTIHTAAEEIEGAGGQALAIQTDIRHEGEVEAAIAKTVERFGGIDILVNNASAIFLAGTQEVPMKRFDLMWSVNARGSFVCSKHALPHLLKADNPHILTLSPPLNMSPRWFAQFGAYTMAKYGMSCWVLGMSEEFRSAGVAVNALWPQTVILTAALAMLPPELVEPKACRKPEIMADAAHAILCRGSRSCTGNFFIDDQVLAEEGVVDFERYAVEPGAELSRDLFLDA
jgi:citronellol/citronellal dehydrogenase